MTIRIDIVNNFRQNGTDTNEEGQQTVRISLTEFRQRLGDPHLAIVDVRALPAYNGWRSSGAARGGHIPGAVAFPSAWLESVDGPEVERLLRSKGILTSREVVLYGDRPEDAVALRTRLAELGQSGVRIFEGGWPEWAGDPTLPVDRLPNYEKLVDDEWLSALLGGGRPEAAPAGQFLLFHVNFGVPEEYEENHIPGALYLDTNRLENPRDWNRRTPEELEAALRSFGIRRDTTVILYGRDTEGHANEKWPGRRAGQIAACRAGDRRDALQGTASLSGDVSGAFLCHVRRAPELTRDIQQACVRDAVRIVPRWEWHLI